MAESKIKITEPQRILRILQRVSQAGLSVLIRSEIDTACLIKGRVTQLKQDGSNAFLRISNISEKGVAFLMSGVKIQVEFIMMSTKVYFISRVAKLDGNSILVQVPSYLVSVERRLNPRFNCQEEALAYIDSAIWKPDVVSFASPPIFSFFEPIGSYLQIADISSGGICLVTRFPAASEIFKKGIIDDGAKIVFPMQSPVLAPIEVRWAKKIKEHVKHENGTNGVKRSYRIGVEFISPSDELKVAVRQFVAQISQLGAI